MLITTGDNGTVKIIGRADFSCQRPAPKVCSCHQGIANAVSIESRERKIIRYRGFVLIKTAVIVVGMEPACKTIQS